MSAMTCSPQMLVWSRSLFPSEPCAELNSCSSGVLTPCLPSLCKCATLQGFTGSEGNDRTFSRRVYIVVPHFKEIFSVTTFPSLEYQFRSLKIKWPDLPPWPFTVFIPPRAKAFRSITGPSALALREKEERKKL